MIVTVVWLSQGSGGWQIILTITNPIKHNCKVPGSCVLKVSQSEGVCPLCLSWQEKV